jgi:polyisoprenoid-binding protein YceI
MSVTTSPATRTYQGIEVPVPGTYLLDTTHTSLAFSVRHLMVSRVRGRFTSFTGTVLIADDPLASSVEVSVDTASIDTNDPNRDEHLRSPDFLDCERYPVMSYRGSGVERVGHGWRVDGELTLHGATRSVPLDVTFEGALLDPFGSTRAGFGASTEIDREGFGLTWNQALDAGGVVLGKQVRIEVDAEAVRQSE